MQVTTSRIRPSPFDTELLGVRVGKVRVEGLDRRLIEELHAELAATDLDVVFVRDTDFPFERVADMPWTGLELTDVKVTLSRPVPGVVAEQRDDFIVTSAVGPDDAPGLVELVHSIARWSRFHRCFGEAAACRLYEAWLANSLARRAADWCFLARRTNDTDSAGFIAVKREGDTADLTLVATAAKYQRQGVMRLMTSAVLACLRSAGVTRCTVATQLSNHAALRAYQALGFAFEGTLVDLHVSR